MESKPLSVIGISALSAFTGIGSIFEVQVNGDDIGILVRNELIGDTLTVRHLNKVVEYFKVKADDVSIISYKEFTLIIQVLGQKAFTPKLTEDLGPEDDSLETEAQKCCGRQPLCPGCPNGK